MFILAFFFEIGCALVDLSLKILLSYPPKSWDYTYVSSLSLTYFEV